MTAAVLFGFSLANHKGDRFQCLLTALHSFNSFARIRSFTYSRISTLSLLLPEICISPLSFSFFNHIRSLLSILLPSQAQLHDLKSKMKLFSLTLALAALQTAAGHTVFTTLFVNDVDQGDGTCVRMPMTPDNATDPINDLASNDMACGKFARDILCHSPSRILMGHRL